MKMEGPWKIVVFGAIAIVGISGIVEAMPYARESLGDLAIDITVLAGAMGISVLIARFVRTKSSQGN